MAAIIHNEVTGDEWEVESVEDAEKWIGEREAVDPDGVFNGNYTIDNMN